MIQHMIALVDCDSFFVSCEQVKNPTLRGRPVCVVTGENGCVVSRSREAKKAGVKMGMPLFMARREFPDVIYLNGCHDLYRRFSAQVMNHLRALVAEVEVVSIDEAYADLTSLDAVYHTDYFSLARQIREKILRAVGIPVSIGIAPSKKLAKLASDKAKNTGGVFSIASEQIKTVLQQTDINDICGIGRSHSKLMGYNGIGTAWDYVSQPDAWIRRRMGVSGLELKYELLGYYIHKLETRPAPPQSVQDTSALPVFTSDPEIIRSQLRCHLHQACRRMRRDNCFCTVAGIMLRTKDFAVISDRVKLSAASNAELDIAAALIPLLKNIYRPGIVYRSSGVCLSGLVCRENDQPELFDSLQFKSSPLSEAWDLLENKFGRDVLKNGWF